MKNLLPAALLSAILAVPSCAPLTPEQQAVVGEAKSIRKYPVKRTELIRKLGLDGIRGRREAMVLNAGYFVTESWEHPSGLVVSGHHEGLVKAGHFTRSEIEAMLSDPDLSTRERRWDISLIPTSFERVTANNARGKVVFDSASLEEVAILTGGVQGGLHRTE